MKLRIQSKLLLYILTTVFLLFLISYGYLVLNIKSISEKNALSQTNIIAKESALYLEQILNTDVETVKALKNTLFNFDKLDSTSRENLINDIIPNIMREAPQFLSLNAVWELSAIDSNYHKPYGRVRYVYYWDEGTVKLVKDYKNLEGDDLGGLYYRIKVDEKPTITEPYFDSYSGLEIDMMQMSSIAFPIVNNGYKGMVVSDISLERFGKIVEDIKPYKEASAFLISNEGNLITFNDEKYINTKISDYYKEEEAKNNITENIKAGNEFSYHFTDTTGIESYITYFPINIGDFGNFWSLAVVVPLDIIQAESDRIFMIAVVVGIIGILIMTFIIWFISKNISKPLENITEVLKKLAKGEINESFKSEVHSSDEIGEISDSVNKLVEGLNNTAKFAFEIKKGNLDADLALRSNEDTISKAFIEMRESLKAARKEELKRKEEDIIHNWSNKGETMFGVILRERSENIEEFSYKIISNLVKYIGANQGGIFVINDDIKSEVYLELTASYAYDRKKNIQKKINIGVGLVGRCYQEGETIYMNNIPSDYLNITSGLGEENPNHLLIVPFKFNEEIYAVVELASFNKFEQHHIDFVERVGVSIASTIGSVKINVRTSRLVDELKVQSEELSSQEEEMRQNMEEMQSTQEELAKKAEEYGSVIDAINEVSFIAEYDMNGKLTHINEKFLKFIGKTYKEMVGKYQGTFNVENEQFATFDSMWNDLKAGKTKNIVQHVKISNRDYWLSEYYSPVLDRLGKPYKVLNISIDITKSVQSGIDFK